MKTFGQKKMVRKMNYISDQEGIINRYFREKDHWQVHLEKTKKFILESFNSKEIKSIAILGSGWLLDLPLKELASRYKNLLLVDVYHPAQIRKKVEKFKNVTLFETDLTGGGIEFCWQLRKRKDEHYTKYILDDFKPKKPEFPLKVDAYISLNILNQLDILLVDYINKKNGRITENEVLRFRKTIQQFHLDWISRKPACLITDYKELNADKDGDSDELKLVHITFPKTKREEEWTWDFDLSKMYRKGKETRMKVRAFEW